MDETKLKDRNDSGDGTEKVNVIVKDGDENETVDDQKINVAVKDEDTHNSEEQSDSEDSNSSSNSEDSGESIEHSEGKSDVQEQPNEENEESTQLSPSEHDMDSSEDTKTPNSDTQPEQNDLMPPPDDESKSSDHGNEDTDSQTPAREEATNDEGLAPVAQPPDETADDSMADSHDGHTNHQAQPSMAMPMMADPNAMQATNEAANIKPVHPHRNNRKFAVLMILIIGLLLAGIAVYVYLSTSKNTAELNSSLPTKSSTAGNSETDSQSKTTPATTKDVDAASSQVDQTVQSLNDNSDLAEDKISDQTLGIQ